MISTAPCRWRFAVHFAAPSLPSRRRPVEPELAVLPSLGNDLRAHQTDPSDLDRLCQVADFSAAAAEKLIYS